MEITERMVAGYVTAVCAAIEAAGHQLHSAPSYLADPEEPIHATIRIADPGEGGLPVELTWEPGEGGSMGQGWTAAYYHPDTGRRGMHTDLRLGVVALEETVAQAVTAILATGRLEAGRVVPGIPEQLAPYETWPNL